MWLNAPARVSRATVAEGGAESAGRHGSGNEFDLRHRCAVATTRHELEGAREAAGAALVARNNLGEELFQHLFVVQLRGTEPACVQVVGARGADQPLDLAPQLRRLGFGGLQTLMTDEVRHEIADQSQAMAGRSAEFSHCDTVTHHWESCYSSSVSSSVAVPSTAAPLAEAPNAVEPASPSGSTPCSCNFSRSSTRDF